MSEPQKQQESCPICRNTTGTFDFDFIASEMCEFHRNCLFPKQNDTEWLDKNCTGCSECEPDVHPKPVASEAKPRMTVQVAEFLRLAECNAFLATLDAANVRRVDYTPAVEGFYDSLYTVIYEVVQ